MRSESPKHMTHGRRSKWDTSGVLLDDEIAAGPVDLVEVFGNARPVELEVGTGKGTFLLARAQARGELNFLGIERARSYAEYSADRFRRAQLTNVRMLCADAAHFIRRSLGDSSLWRVHIYFPDPWPKRRHHRRRTVSLSFMREIHRVLAPGGQVILVTDHLEYFQHIQRVLANTVGFVTVRFPRMGDSKGELVGTNFERKYIAQGRGFFDVALMKYARGCLDSQM